MRSITSKALEAFWMPSEHCHQPKPMRPGLGHTYRTAVALRKKRASKNLHGQQPDVRYPTSPTLRLSAQLGNHHGGSGRIASRVQPANPTPAPIAQDHSCAQCDKLLPHARNKLHDTMIP